MRKIISKMKDNVLTNQYIYTYCIAAIIIIGFIAVMYKVDLSSKVLSYASHRSNQDEVQMVHDFTSGMEIRQNFKSYSDFDFITLSFSDHDQRLQGKLGILVRDLDTDNTVCYKEIDMLSVRYNVPIEISFEEAGGGKANTKYEISLFAAETGDTALGVFGYKTTEETAMINGEKSEYALSIGIHSYTPLYYDITKIILGLSIVAVFLVIIVTFKVMLKEEYIFLLLAIPFVLGMLVLWPGNAVYDEARHYHTIYYYSNAFLGCGAEDSFTQIKMRECDIINSKELDELSTPINAQAQKYYYYIGKMWDKADNKEMVAVDISNMSVVPDGLFIQYTPGIVGMSIARVLGCNHFWMMTITRLGIIGFYLLLCFYAIRKIPVLKTMVALVAALPVNLYQVSGISYDSFTFAVGIVVFAFIIRLWYSELSKNEWFILGVFVFLLGNCKGGVYLTLILLMILIPKEKYRQKKWLKFGSILGVAGVSMLGGFFSTIMSWINMSVVRNVETPNVGISNVVETLNTSESVVQRLSPGLVVNEPVRFTEMFVQTMIERMDIYLGQLLGYRTAWSNQPMDLVVLIPFLVLVILAVINREGEEFKIGSIAKTGIFAILLFELIGMHIIFLAETPIYYATIVGFQGRYFVSFLPCILLLFRNEFLVYKGKIQSVYPVFSMAQVIYWYFFLRMFMVH